MSRMLFCTYLQRQAVSLASAPYPGKLGEQIYNEISQEAWKAWQAKQTMLINEKKLTLMHSADRQLLEEAMVQFLFEGRDIPIAGYMPNAISDR